jgi:hypothetical protein
MSRSDNPAYAIDLHHESIPSRTVTPADFEAVARDWQAFAAESTDPERSLHYTNMAARWSRRARALARWRERASARPLKP